MTWFKNESGQALFLVIMVIMVLMLIGAAALTRTSGSRLRSFEQKKMVQSSYIAEAGVEKALANIRNNPFWLKGLSYNTPVNYITMLSYAGGQITSVEVTRTSTGDNPTTFFIKSQGDYHEATRTIKVSGEMYDPIDFGKGVWVRNDAVFSNNSIYNSSVTGGGNLTFKQNTHANGDIMATGNVSLENNMTANSIVSGGSLSLAENVEITTNARAAVDITVASNAVITGTANAINNIGLANNSKITGDVYYNGNLTQGSGATTGTPHPGGATPVVVSIPPFPLLDESIYEQNPDRILTGTISGSLNLDGISYAPGDLLIHGLTYSGTGMIVSHGKVTIDGDLYRANEQSSLAIISFGNVDGVGIEVYNNFVAYALLYSPNLISLHNNSEFYGSTVSSGIVVDSNVGVSYEPKLKGNHPPWMTTVVKIKSWKESNPVF